MEECIFCKIGRGEIKCNRVYEDDNFIAFRDINPQAPVHILIIPKKHIAKLYDTEDISLLGRLLHIASKIAKDEGIEQSGYRVVINTNRNAGQSVEHLHLHLLGGRIMQWPPG
ncbi:MAG TPA: histidine triad nucleotide-binding protein [bacterium]|nr:histidine triad nucleotide-binding protein [bacterium]HPP30042.1 histidine triad nucleotide-binding protein [bacterium]